MNKRETSLEEECEVEGRRKERGGKDLRRVKTRTRESEVVVERRGLHSKL